MPHPLCMDRLRSFCQTQAACEHQGPLVPLFDSSVHHAELAWRCYAPSALDSTGERFAGGSSAYCTRHAALSSLLTACVLEVQGSIAAERESRTSLRLQETVQPYGGSKGGDAPILSPWLMDAWQPEVTVTAMDTGSFVPSPERELARVLAWEVPCIDKYEDHKLKNYTGNVSRKKAFLSREGLSCFGTCVRGVVDGFATHDEARQIRTLARHPTPDSPSNIDLWRWDVAEQPTVFRQLVNRAKTVLREQFGVSPLRFYRSNIITWDGSPLPSAAAERHATATRPRTWHARSLHGDTNTDEMFIYTTILYLSQHGDDVVGGETGIADEVDALSRQVTAGLRVQPSVGRLLVFSAGAENMHEMLPVTHGQRIAVQMWFACEGMDPGWARPQRERWQEQHGYGGPDSFPPQVRPPVSDALKRAPPWQWRAFGGGSAF